MVEVIDLHMIVALGTTLLLITMVDWLILMAVTGVVDLILIGAMQVSAVVGLAAMVGWVNLVLDMVVTMQV